VDGRVAQGVITPIRVETAAGYRTMDREAQSKALRLRMYVLCSECSYLVDLAEGNRPQRDVEGTDLVRHAAEEHAAWLEVLDILS